MVTDTTTEFVCVSTNFGTEKLSGAFVTVAAEVVALIAVVVNGCGTETSPSVLVLFVSGV